VRPISELTLDEYVALCAKAGADPAIVKRVSIETLEHLRGKSSERERSLLELEERWYASLEARAPDFSVYAEDAYLGELWACWIIYSRPHLRAIASKLAIRFCNVRAVADLGCGCGLASAALRELFPTARVVGTNFEDTVQMRVARMLGSQYGFDLVSRLEDVGSVDLVLASEYFEHIPNPIAHWADVARLTQPRYALIANAFGARAIGHFHFYFVDGVWLAADSVGRKFNAQMRADGYAKIKTGLWNERPALWSRESTT
jgi:hypothetical protein